MTYNIFPFLSYLGFHPGEEVYIIHAVSDKLNKKFHIKNLEDIPNANIFVDLHNGVSQLYISLNPLRSDIDPNSYGTNEEVKCVRNVLIDIDSNHPKDNPATDSELTKLDDTVQNISDKLDFDGTQYHLSQTGNGMRFIIPIPDSDIGISKHIRALIKQLHKKYKQIDVAVTDARRITGLNGTYNIKKETSKRKNRMREEFNGQVREENEDFLEKLYNVPIIEGVSNYKGDITIGDKLEEVVKHLAEKDKVFLSILNKAHKSRKGSRSEIDWQMACYLAEYNICEEDIARILYKLGTSRCKDLNYVTYTVNQVIA